MTARQALDRAVLRIAGKDIRLVGNWQPLWCLRHYSAEIAAAIQIAESDLTKCRDISDIVTLMERRRITAPQHPHQPALL